MRFANIDDAAEIAKLAEEIWTEYFPTIIDREEAVYILNKIQSEDSIREQMNDGYLYSFIEVDGKRIGYICIRPEDDALLMSKLYVIKDFRGKGIGSRMLDEILNKGREMNVSKTYLRVNRNNALAMRAYKAKGFVIVKEEKLDLGNGFYMDDYLMEYRYE